MRNDTFNSNLDERATVYVNSQFRHTEALLDDNGLNVTCLSLPEDVLLFFFLDYFGRNVKTLLVFMMLELD